MSQPKFLTIGIRGSGPGSGKDTACEHIMKHIGNARHEKFATPLRECVQAITGVPVEKTQTVEGKNMYFEEMEMTIGKFLQIFGTEIVKNNMYPNVWVDALFRRFRDDEIVVISDVRFPNEQEAVKNRKGIVLEINSNREIDDTQVAGRSLNHASERALDGFPADYTIHNNGTLEELEKKLDDFLKTISL
jgi:hypothetical protein